MVRDPFKFSKNIIVISAPSGAGKTSICVAIVKGTEDIANSISYTTRQPREDEKNGRDYFFVSEIKFKKMIRNENFVEWAKVHGNYYGTSRVLLNKLLKTGKKIFLRINVQGGMNIKKRYPNACLIFITTPNLKTLKSRLVARNKDDNESIVTRVNNAKKELKYVHKYEYLIINKKINDAISAVKTIIKSLRYKI